MLHLPNEGMSKHCSNSEQGWIHEAWNDQVKTIQARLSLSFVLNCAQDVHPLVTALCMGEEALANEMGTCDQLKDRCGKAETARDLCAR